MINFIYHIADIHIFYKNYTNIQHSFDKLLTTIDTHKDNSLLVIAGDIFEYRSSITPDDILFFQTMIKKLEDAQIKTLIIPGNHDHNVNKYKKNTISSIMVHEYKYVICVSDTQIYSLPHEWKAENLLFYVFSPIDNLTLNLDTNVNPNVKRIALLHEMVSDAKFYSGETIKDQRFSAEWLSNNFDLVLLGDIHKPQFLSAKKNVAYSGSLVQKHIGEDIVHGYILWDANRCIGKFISIPLKEIYLKLEPFNNTCKFPDLDTKQVPVIRYLSIEYTGCTDWWITEFIKNCESKYKICVDKLVNCDEYILIKNEENNIKTIDLSKPDVQIKTISNILHEEKYPYTQEIIDLHKNMLNLMSPNMFIKWKLNYLLFNNILCYSGENYINFSHLNNDLVSILGDNKIGKSAIIDILIFILFNRSIRGAKKNILNNNSKKGYIKCSINIKGEEYIIEQYIRSSTKKANKVECKLYKYENNNVKIIDGGDLNKMYEHLEKKIGTYENFLQLNCSIQNRNFLVDEKSKDKLEFFCKFLDISVLGEIEKKIQEQFREVKNKLKQVKELQHTETDIKKIIKVCSEINEQKSKTDAELNIQTDNLKELRNSLNNIYKNYKHTTPETIAQLEEQYKNMKDFVKNNIPLEIDLMERRKQLEQLTRENIAKIAIAKNLLEPIKDVCKPDIIVENDPEINGQLKDLYMKYVPCREFSDAEMLDKMLNNRTYDDLKKSRDELHKVQQKYNLGHYNTADLQDINTIYIQFIKEFGASELPDTFSGEHTVLLLILERLTDPKIIEVIKKRAPQNIARPEESKYTETTEKLNNLIYSVKKRIVKTDENLNFLIKKSIRESFKKEIERIEFNNLQYNFNVQCPCCKVNKEILYDTSGLEFLKRIYNSAPIEESPIDLHDLLGKYEKELHTREQQELYKRDQKNKRIYDLYHNLLNNIKGLAHLSCREQTNQLDKLMDYVEYKQTYSHENADILKQINTIENNIQLHIAYKNYMKKISLESELKSLNEDKNKISNDYTNILKQFKYKEYIVQIPKVKLEIEACKKNILIHEQIENMTKNEKALIKNIEELNKRSIEYMTKLNKYSMEINQYNQLKQINEQHIKQLSIYTRYIKLLNSKKGLPSLILNKACIILTKECNKILNDITDFQIKFEFNEGIEINTIYKNSIISAEMGSGFQKFIIDLCIRIVLTNISRISRPNILIIDEGFGCLDAHNFYEIKKCLINLKRRYDFIMIISHIQELKSCCDKFIHITKTDQTSKIMYGQLDPKQKSIILVEDLNKINNDVIRMKRTSITETKEDKQVKKNMLKSKIQTYIQQNNTIEKVIENIQDITFYCNICEKQNNARGTHKQHINTKTHLKIFETKLKKNIIKLQ